MAPSSINEWFEKGSPRRRALYLWGCSRSGKSTEIARRTRDVPKLHLSCGSLERDFNSDDLSIFQYVIIDEFVFDEKLEQGLHTLMARAEVRGLYRKATGHFRGDCILIGNDPPERNFERAKMSSWFLKKIFVVHLKATEEPLRLCDSSLRSAAAVAARARRELMESIRRREKSEERRRSERQAATWEEKIAVVISEILGDSTSCSICMDDLLWIPGVVAKLKCRHAYHKKCIDGWMKMSGACALCKTTISEVEVVA